MFKSTLMLLAAPALLMFVGTAGAQSNSLSDRMLISIPGAVVFDNSIPELVTAGEPPLVFGGGPAPVSPAIPPGVAITTPGVSLVLLTEPAGEPVDPGEVPIVISTPNGPQILS